MTSSNPNWEDQLDIDDSDLPLTPSLRPYKSQAPQTLIIKSTQKIDRIDLVESTPVTVRPGPAGVLQVEKKPVRIIPGPAGVLQLAKMRKQADVQLVGDDSVLSTQEYMQLVVEGVVEDSSFNSGPWVGATKYMKLYGVEVSGCLGDVEKFLKKGKLELVVGIMKSRSPNFLRDLNVTVKDLSGTLLGSINYKILKEGSYAKDIAVVSAIILTNVSVFSHKQSHTLNITKRNLVKVFNKYFVPGNGSDIGGTEMFMDEEEIMRLVEEYEMAEIELVVGGNANVQDELYKFDEEALEQLLEEEAREEREHEEWVEKCRKQQEEDDENERGYEMPAKFYCLMIWDIGNLTPNEENILRVAKKLHEAAEKKFPNIAIHFKGFGDPDKLAMRRRRACYISPTCLIDIPGREADELKGQTHSDDYIRSHGSIKVLGMHLS